MTHLLARFALLSGNFITGTVVLAPAGMLPQLAEGLGVSISGAGLLVTFGAVVLCIASPIVSWLTTRLDRRLLATGVLAVAAICSFMSAFADSYALVLTLRLVMVALIAIYTPLAASTISLIVPEAARASAVAFIFLGWSLSIALGLPIVTFLANQFGWRETYVAIGIVAAAAAFLNFIALPGRLRGFPLSLQSFAFIARNRRLVLILLLTLLSTSGIFQITIFLGPLLSKLAGAGAATAGTFFFGAGHCRSVRKFRGDHGGRAHRCREHARMRAAGADAGGCVLGTRRGLSGCDGDWGFSGRSRAAFVEYHAAGAVDRGGAGSCKRDSGTEHVVDLCRPGDRLRERRIPV
jgi:predicted MFS family arabinose efflux permease